MVLWNERRRHTKYEHTNYEHRHKGIKTASKSYQNYFIFHISYFIFCREAAARGIEAEPPVGAGLMRTSGAHPARARSAQG